MIRKLPERSQSNRKQSKTHALTVLKLPRNRKQVLRLRFLAPICRYEQDVFSWYDFLSRLPVTRHVYGYLAFVIDHADNRVKLFEFNNGILDCLGGSGDRWTRRELTDPGHDLSGCDWTIHFDRISGTWKAQREQHHPLNKHDRKVIAKFIQDTRPQDRDLRHLSGFGSICPVFRNAESALHP